jgi:hypothetical protein
LTFGISANAAIEDVAAHPSMTHIGGTFTVVPMTIPAATMEAVGAGYAQSNSTSICSRFFESKRAVAPAICGEPELPRWAVCTTCWTRGETRDCQSKDRDPGVAATPTVESMAIRAAASDNIGRKRVDPRRIVFSLDLQTDPSMNDV